MKWRSLLDMKGRDILPVELHSHVVDEKGDKGVVSAIVHGNLGKSYYIAWQTKEESLAGFVSKQDLCLDLDSTIGFIQALKFVSNTTCHGGIKEWPLEQPQMERLKKFYDLWVIDKILEPDRTFVVQCAAWIAEAKREQDGRRNG